MKKKVILIIGVIVLLVIIVGLVICSVNKSQIGKKVEGINDQAITKIGKTDEYNKDISKLGKVLTIDGKTITGKDLASMNVYKVTVTQNMFKKDLDKRTFVAVSFKDLLKKAKVNSKKSLKVTASDDYSITLEKKFITDDAYFGIFEKSKQVNTLFAPSYEPCNWVQNIVTIEVA